MLFLCIQPFDNFITNKTLAISDYHIERVFLFSKIKKKMDMIRHYGIAKELVTALIQNPKEFVNLVMGICKLNQMEPLEAGKSDKISRGSSSYSMERHAGKIRRIEA